LLSVGELDEMFLDLYEIVSGLLVRLGLLLS